MTCVFLHSTTKTLLQRLFLMLISILVATISSTLTGSYFNSSKAFARGDDDDNYEDDDYEDDDDEEYENRRSRRKKRKKRKQDIIDKVMFFSLNGGILRTTSDDPAIELPKDGSIIGLDGRFSYLTDGMIFDLNLGWVRTTLHIDSKANTTISVEEGEEVKPGILTSEINTRLGSIGVSPRFRLGSVIEIGPTASMLFGSDASLSPDAKVVGNNSNIFFGANLTLSLKEATPKSLFAARIFAEIKTDLSVEARRIDLLTLGIDLGFGIYDRKPRIVVKNRVRTKIRTKIKYKTKYKTKIKRRTKIVTKVKENYLVDAGFINFETDKYDLKAEQTGYLTQLALLLRKKRSYWDHIIITSHTDIRGSIAHNKKLSKNRANAVERFFKTYGIPDNRIIVRSKASTVPVEKIRSKVGLAKNRRVEILVRGPEKTNDIKQDIVILQQQYRMPGTCRGDSCK